MADKNKFDIYDRVFEFAVKVNKFLEGLANNNLIVREYGKQLIRSSGSIGANLQEADGSLTKKDFVNKIGISRREASESKHWLKLLNATVDIKNKNEMGWLINESNEIVLILSSIIKKTKQKG